MARVERRWRTRAALAGGAAATLACAACGPASRAPESAPAAATAPRRTHGAADRKEGVAVPAVAPDAPDPGPRLVLASELTNVRAVLFSPDGTLLAVDDEVSQTVGCFGYTTGVIHVYDTSTWRERLIVWIGERLESWAFAPGSDVLLIASRSNLSIDVSRPISVAAIDMGSGNTTPAGPQTEEPSFPKAESIDAHPARRLRATGSEQHVRVVETGSGKEVARLGPPRLARTFAEVRDEGQKVIFRALWPGGKRAAWDVMTGEAAPFPPGWKPPRPSGELGGDPNAPIALGSADPPVQTFASCEDAECWIDAGERRVRVLAGDEPMTAAVWDGERYDVLGGDAEALFECVSGERVVAFSECGALMPVPGLAGAVRRKALADAEAARRSVPEDAR